MTQSLPAGTIAADPGTRSLRALHRKYPGNTKNERVLAATGRMSRYLADDFKGRRVVAGDFYRTGSGDKFNGEASRSGNRVTVKEMNYAHQGGGPTGQAYSYRIADQAGPRPVGARTYRRRLKG